MSNINKQAVVTWLNEEIRKNEEVNRVFENVGWNVKGHENYQLYSIGRTKILAYGNMLHKIESGEFSGIQTEVNHDEPNRS